MELTPVKSSHIAAVGYLEAEELLVVKFTSGAIHARPGWSASHYANLLAAKSKGKFLHATRGTSILIQKGGQHAGGPSNAGAVGTCEPNIPSEDMRHTSERACSGPLNVLDEDAGRCCQKALRSWPDESEATCPACGLHFEAEMVGPARHWRIKPLIVILR